MKGVSEASAFLDIPSHSPSTPLLRVSPVMTLQVMPNTKIWPVHNHDSISLPAAPDMSGVANEQTISIIESPSPSFPARAQNPL